MSCAQQQRSPSAVCEVVCPKPRRVGPFGSTFTFCPAMIPGSDASETELLEVFLAGKENYGLGNPSSDAAASPPFFSGSPPSRASNPVTQDARFNGRDAAVTVASPSASSPRWMKFGHKPAALRIEGFDCLGQDRRDRSIFAVA